MKGIEIGYKVTVIEYRAGNEVFHNLHGKVFKTYDNSACIIVDPADATPIIKLFSGDRIVVSYKKIKETAAKAALDPANAQGIERRIINGWRQGRSIDRIKSTVLRSESTIYRVLKKYGIDPDAPRVKAKKVKPFTIPHLSR